MTAVYRRSPDVVFRKVGAESVLVPIRSNVGDLEFVYTLSPTAAHIWSLLDGRRPADEIVQSLCAEFDVDAETAAADVHELLGDLAGEALISQVSPS